MARTIVNINDKNIIEWIHSVGYFLPRNECEHSRFEKLYDDFTCSLDVKLIDPFKIISDEREPQKTGQTIDLTLKKEIEELRMAARKHQGIPKYMLDKLKKNQQGDDKRYREE